MFPLVKEAVESVVSVSSLQYIGLSHFEADECGALNAVDQVNGVLKTCANFLESRSELPGRMFSDDSLHRFRQMLVSCS